jgi:hypothetical protein
MYHVLKYYIIINHILDTKANGVMEELMEKVHCDWLMVMFIVENGKMLNDMV